MKITKLPRLVVESIENEKKHNCFKGVRWHEHWEDGEQVVDIVARFGGNKMIGWRYIAGVLDFTDTRVA